MQEKIYITAGGRQCEYKAGTTFKEIAEDFQKEYKDEILLVKANFRLYELNNKAKSDTVLEFITAKDRPGQQTYERSAVLLMMAAFDKLMQQDRTCPEIRINIEFSTGNALFITASASINQDILDRVKSKMQELVRECCCPLVCNLCSAFSFVPEGVIHSFQCCLRQNHLSLILDRKAHV